MEITLKNLSVEQARRVLDFVESSNGATTAYTSTSNPSTEVPPLSPVAASSAPPVEPAPATAADPVDVQAVREAVRDTVNRINASQPDGNANATAHIVNTLDAVCGCKKVTDIAPEQYGLVIEALAKLGV
jgi:hypothetical protein